MPDPVLIAEWNKAGVWTPLGTPRSASIRRGKNKALDAIDAGRMVLTLPNEARQNDPLHNAEFATLRPGSRIRLRATYNGTTYDLFTGYLERPSQYFGNPQTPNDAEIVYEVADGLALLAAVSLPSAYEITMRDHTPRAWLRMGERKGPYFYDRGTTGARIGVGVGNISYGVQALVAGNDDAAATFPTDRASYMVTGPGFLPASNVWSISFALYIPNTPTVNQLIFYDSRGDMGLGCFIDTAGKINVTYKNSAGQILTSVKGGTTVVGNTYQINIVSIPGVALRIYVGDYYDNQTHVGTGPNITDTANSYLIWGLTGTGGYPITLDEIATFDYSLSDSQLFDLEQSLGGWVGFPPSDQIEWILEAAKWDALGNTVIGNVDEDGQMLQGFSPSEALDYLQKIASTIEGRFWIRPDGKLQFLSRNDHNQGIYVTAAAAFTDEPGGLGYHSLGRYSEDWTAIANVVRRTNGETVTVARDQASIDTYGLRDKSPAADSESLFETPARDYDLAAYRLDHYKQPTPEVEGIELNPRGNANLWPIVLDLDLGRRVSFRRTPQGIGAPIIHETILEGISHDIRPKRWITTYNVDGVNARKYFRFDNTVWDSPDWRFSA